MKVAFLTERAGVAFLATIFRFHAFAQEGRKCDCFSTTASLHNKDNSCTIKTEAS